MSAVAKLFLFLTVIALVVVTALLIRETSSKPKPGDLRVDLCHKHPAYSNSPVQMSLPVFNYTADGKHYSVTLDTIRGSTDCGRLADQSIPTAEGTTNFAILRFEIDGLEAPSSDGQFPSGDRLILYPSRYEDGRWVQDTPYPVFPNEINGEHGRVFIVNHQGRLTLN